MNIPVSENLIISEGTLPVITQFAERIPGGFFIYHADGDQELIYFNSHLPAIFGCADDDEFRALTGNSFRGIVHPDDYARSENDIKEQIQNASDNIDHVRYRFIRKDGSTGVLDDYGHFVRSESFGDIYYVFVQDITQEILDQKRASQNELLSRILDYEGVFLVDCVNDTRRTFHDRLSGAANYDDTENYSSAFSRYVENFVCQPDYALMKGFTDPSNILKILGDRKELSVSYRDRTTGVQRFYEMRIIRFSDTEVLQCFRNNDAEMVNSLLFEKLKENYFAILEVDLESGLLRSYKDDPLHVVGSEGEVSTLSSVMMNIAAFFEGETKAFFEKYSDVKNIRERFAREDSAEYICRSADGEGRKWVDVTGIVFSRNADGEPSQFCLTFNYLDERLAEVQDMQELLGDALAEAREANARIAEQQLLAGRAEQARKEQIAKIAGTESTYIVDPETGRFQILGQNEYLSEHYAADEDFDASFSRYIASDVFESDRKMVSEAISIPAMVSHLEKENEYLVRYRDISKGVPRWYEMRAVRLSPSEILYSFSDKDEEIISQIMTESFRATYFGLYYVNLDSGLAQIVKTGHPEITGEAGRYVNYPELMKSIASSSYGEAAAFFNKISDIGYIRNRFAVEDFAYHVYKSYIFEGSRWVNYTGRVLQRHLDGTPAVFALALSLLDEEATLKEEAGLKMKEYQAGLQEALARVTAEQQRNEIFINTFNAGKWSYEISADDRVISADYGDKTTGHFSLNYSGDPMGWAEKIHPDEKEQVLRQFMAAIYDHSCATPYNISYRILGSDGEYRWAKAAGRIVRREDGTGEFFGMCMNITDQIREQEKQRKQLEEALMMAQAANNAKTEFLFNMSHDIRTPMNAILGFTGMAKKHLDSREKVSDYLEKIDSSGKQLLELINQVLEMSRIESGKTDFKESPVNVMEQFNSSVTMLAGHAAERGLEFHHSLIDAVHLNVFADTAKMSSVTLNIAGNALKYTPSGGRIDYTLREIPARRPGYATYVFTVADTGIGMSREFLETMYDPFTREQNSTMSSIQGTGLGLSIVKKLTDLMGGSIEVQSEPGKGTRFDVTLDFRINEEAEKKAEEAPLHTAVSFAGRKALLVEDNELNRDIAADILGETGLEIETAVNGAEAVAMLKEKGPDCYDFILMDIQMPVMNGYEATKAIRAMYPDKPITIIALSANAFEEDRKASVAAGMNGHVAKPIDVNELFSTISKYLLPEEDQ